MNRKLIVTVILVAIVAVVASALLTDRKSSSPQKKPSTLGVKSTLDEIDSQEIEYYKDTTGYYVKPKNSTSLPGVVMIHDQEGLNDFIKQKADLLAMDGFAVIAVDLFSQGQTADNINQVNTVANMKSAIQYLMKEGSADIGVVGWGFGGYEALLLNISDDNPDAVVIYYGKPIINDELLSQISGPILGLYGKDDKEVSLANVEKMESSLNEMGLNNDIVMYSGTGYKFADPDSPNYNKEKSENAWAKTLFFFEENLKHPSMP